MKHTARQLTQRVGTTLDRFIASRQTVFPFASGDLSQLLRDIALAAKIINREILLVMLIKADGFNGKCGHRLVQDQACFSLNSINKRVKQQNKGHKEEK